MLCEGIAIPGVTNGSVENSQVGAHVFTGCTLHLLQDLDADGTPSLRILRYSVQRIHHNWSQSVHDVGVQGAEEVAQITARLVGENWKEEVEGCAGTEAGQVERGA